MDSDRAWHSAGLRHDRASVCGRGPDHGSDVAVPSPVFPWLPVSSVPALLLAVCRHLRVAVCIVVGAWTLLAVDVDPQPPLGPDGAREPMVPGPVSPMPSDPRQRLARQMEERLRTIDQRLQQLLDDFGGHLPPIDLRHVSDLEDERLLNQEARQRLQEVLDMHLREAAVQRRDVLDTPPAQVDPRILRGLEATNRLMIAQCYGNLHGEGSTVEQRERYLRAGFAALSEVVAADVPVSHRPTYHYHRLWYAVHRISIEPQQRDVLMAEAEEHLGILRRRHSESLLVKPAEELLRTVAVTADLEDA